MSADEAGPNETGALSDGTRVECITVPPQLERVADVRDFIDTLGLQNDAVARTPVRSQGRHVGGRGQRHRACCEACDGAHLHAE